MRVMRACRELGVETVAVYSEADRNALHVQAADRAVLIGASPAADSYLAIPRVIQAALESGAHAVHPGLWVSFRRMRPSRRRAWTRG